MKKSKFLFIFRTKSIIALSIGLSFYLICFLAIIIYEKYKESRSNSQTIENRIRRNNAEDGLIQNEDAHSDYNS